MFLGLACTCGVGAAMPGSRGRCEVRAGRDTDHGERWHQRLEKKTEIPMDGDQCQNSHATHVLKQTAPIYSYTAIEVENHCNSNRQIPVLSRIQQQDRWMGKGV